MKNYMMAAVFLAFAALPAFASPVSFSECPAVGDDTSGCELLITVTAASNGVATAFTVSTSSPDLGPFNGSDDTLIGVLNDSNEGFHSLYFTVAPGSGTFDFNQTGACEEIGGVDIYSPAPTAAQCLQGQYQTMDAFDYATAHVTFLSFNLADAGVLVEPPLGPGQSSWFDLPGHITASEITMVTPEPSMVIPLLIALLLLALVAHLRSDSDRLRVDDIDAETFGSGTAIGSQPLR